MEHQHHAQVQQQPPQPVHMFYPPDDGGQEAMGIHYAHPGTYGYIIGHAPLPIVPSHMGLGVPHMYQPAEPQHVDPGQLHQPMPVQHGAHTVMTVDDSVYPMPPPLDLEFDSQRANGAALSRTSSASSSVAPSPASSTRNGHSLRYNPMASPAGSSRSSSSARRRSVDEAAFSDDAFDPSTADFGSVMTENHKAATKQQRIVAEQRRRNDLRDGYAKLRDVLPSKNLKGAKVAVLDRATSYIQQLESENHVMKMRLATAEDECTRLRGLNEMISMGLGARIAQAQSGQPAPHRSQPGGLHVGHGDHSLAAPSHELGHLHLHDNGSSASLHTQQQHYMHGVDPAAIMPPPHGATPQRDESFSPPSSTSEASS